MSSKIISRTALPLAAIVLLAACGGGEAKQMPPEEYERLVLESVQFLKERQDSLEKEFRLSKYARYTWDQRTGQLVFSQGDSARVIAEVQFAGSVSKKTKTWLWAWANPSVVDERKASARSVRRYGEQYGIARLTDREWPADANDGWEMTAMAARVTSARGAHRSADGDGETFLLITAIRWADSTRAQADTAP